MQLPVPKCLQMLSELLLKGRLPLLQAQKESSSLLDGIWSLSDLLPLGMLQCLQASPVQHVPRPQVQEGTEGRRISLPVRLRRSL